MNQPISFFRWLLMQTQRDDLIGELARYVEEDMAAPSNARTLDRWVKYLEYVGKTQELRRSLNFAWNEYLRGEGYPSDAKRRYCIGHLDREYAQSVGDPVLAVVDAIDQRDALDQASKMRLAAPSGIWVWLEG